MSKVNDFAIKIFKDLASKKIPVLQHPNDFIPFMEFAADYFKDKKEIRFLEIGILFGGSFKIFGETMQHIGHDVFGVAVDLPSADDRFGGIKNPNIPDSLKSIKPDFDWDMIVGNSRDESVIEKVRHFAPFDLVFVDGDHTVAGHTADKNNYLPMTRGLMAFHDLAEPEHEVCKNWPNIRAGFKYWEFKFTDHYGIGVIQVK